MLKMGMYDEINGEQVKCFPWVSFYKDEINYHGGELKCYATGSEVPYKKPHYNYGKNFIILDLNMYRGEPFGEDYNYILHIIVDGKVKNTLTDECANIDWSINNVVVGYRGELINVKTEEEFLQYIKAQREYWAKHDQINERHSQLFKESMEYFHGMPSFGVTDCRIVIFGVIFEKDLGLVFTVIQNSATDNFNLFGVRRSDAGVDHRSLVDKKGLVAFKLDKADVVLAFAEIYDILIGYIDVIFLYGVDENMQSIVPSVGLEGKICAFREGKANNSVGAHLGDYSERKRTDDRLFKGLLGDNLKAQRLVA